MRKIAFMLSAATALLLTSAAAVDYEFTAVAGAVWPEGNLGINSEGIVGGEFQFNNVSEMIKPEIAVFVSPQTDYRDSTKETTISRFVLNGVHEYETVLPITPFVKAGLGYEDVSDELHDNEDSMMADAGFGFKHQWTDTIALKAEALYMLKYNSDRWDNNLAGLLGLTFSFGGGEAAAAVPTDSDNDGVYDSEDACPGTPAGAVVDSRGCIPDTDADGVLDPKDECPDTPAGEIVDTRGCLIDSDKDGVPDMSDKCPGTTAGAVVDGLGCEVDDDRDGVPNLHDSCPDTREGFAVDEVGCPVVKTLKLHFEFGSAKIAPESEATVAEYAQFLKESPSYKAIVMGHTDSVGSDADNMALSKARADSVKAMLVEKGIDPQRLKTEGKGETQPVASNDTAEGRAKNRRIEVWLLK
ncbi:MAG: OmpA family protein [Campylobacterales bacterium]